MHFGSEHGPKWAVWLIPDMTRIEVWRKMGTLIRAEIGEALWLGCGCPLWASVGLVEGVRTGRDASVAWGKGTELLLVNQALRNFGYKGCCFIQVRYKCQLARACSWG